MATDRIKFYLPRRRRKKDPRTLSSDRAILSFNFAVLSAWLRLITRARFRKKKRNDKKNKEGGESFTITRGCTVHGNQVTNRAY